MFFQRLLDASTCIFMMSRNENTVIIMTGGAGKFFWGKSARPRALGIFYQGAWPDSLLNYHLLSPIARASLNRAARPGFSWPAQAPLFGVANPVEICGVEEWSVAEGRSGAPRLSTAYNSPPRPRGLRENASPAQSGPRRDSCAPSPPQHAGS